MSLTARFFSASAGTLLNTLGLKVGRLASARISPVRGFSTTTVPAIDLVSSIPCCSSRSAMYWMVWSMVNTRFCPGSGGFSTRLNHLPRASRETSSLPGIPRKSSSNPRSRPPSPSPSMPTYPRTWAARGCLASQRMAIAVVDIAAARFDRNGAGALPLGEVFEEAELHHLQAHQAKADGKYPNEKQRAKDVKPSTWRPGSAGPHSLFTPFRLLRRCRSNDHVCCWRLHAEGGPL